MTASQPQRASRLAWRSLSVFVALVVAGCSSAAGTAPGASSSNQASTVPSGSAAGGSAAGQKILKIAFQGALTGPVAVIGQPLANAIQLAVDQAAPTLASQGIVLQVVLGDDQVDPSQAPTVAQKILTDGHVVGVVGPMFGSDTNAVGPLYTQASMPMLTIGSAASLSKNGWTLFRLIPNDSIQGSTSADFAVKVVKAQKLAVIDDGTQYGHGLALAVAAEIAKDGAQVVDQEAIDPKATDFSATIGKILASGAQSVFLGASYPQTAQFNRQLRDKGYQGAFFVPDGSLTPDFTKQAGSESEGTYFTCQCAPVPAYGGPATGALADFVSAYQAKYNTAPQAYTAEDYDGAKLLIAAIEAGAQTPAAVTAWLRTANFSGVTKTYSWDPTGELNTTSINIYQVKNGQIRWLGQSTDLIK